MSHSLLKLKSKSTGAVVYDYINDACDAHNLYDSELNEKASFDYTLAQNIGRACGMAFGSIKEEFPDISSIYPTLFDSEEIKQKKQERQAELSALRFKQFAESFNKKFKQQEVAKD